MTMYDDLIFENQNAKLLCTLIHTANPFIAFPVAYMTEEFAVSFYNFLDKQLDITSNTYVPEPKQICYIPVYSKIEIGE